MPEKYDLKKDHEAIKRQMIDWELTLDLIVKEIRDAENLKDIDVNAIADDLEEISHEMMAINL
jgi:hypothetical protein